MASTAASPSVYSPPPTARSKRSLSVTSSDYGESPAPAKKKATSKRSSAAEKEYKKEERMERNRKAAQASRDRKKLQQEGLEARIADLERQLAAAQSAPPASLDHLTLPPRRATSSSNPHRLTSLEEENESLRTQLQLEQLQSATLKVRLGALETKFARLDELLRGDSASVAKLASPVLPPLLTTPTYSFPSLPTPPAPTAFPFLDDVSPAAPPSSAEQSSSKQETGLEAGAINDDERDSLRLVAREADSSLPRKLSHPRRRLLAPLMTLPSSLTPSSLSPPPMARTPSTPTLHQILSSISINPLSPERQSTTTSPSSTPGTIGRSASTSALKTRVVVRLASSPGVQRRDLGARRLNVRRRSRRVEESTTEACSRFSKMQRFQLFVRR